MDLFAIETTMTLAEARAAVLAVRSVSRKPVFVTFTCDENGDAVGHWICAGGADRHAGGGRGGLGAELLRGAEEMLSRSGG